MPTLLLERTQAILTPLSPQKRKEIADIIREVLVRKKKQYLLRDFEKKAAPLLE